MKYGLQNLTTGKIVVDREGREMEFDSEDEAIEAASQFCRNFGGDVYYSAVRLESAPILDFINSCLEVGRNQYPGRN